MNANLCMISEIREILGDNQILLKEDEDFINNNF